MKEITLVMKTPDNVLEEPGVTSAEIEDLHTIGGLVPLLEHLKNSSAGIRAKAAESLALKSRFDLI
ncbi:hypothetical protein MKX01_027881 [Papaver californicum]|nr:hypothetical protein MKX01_027881 [Papaver californicum]